MAPTTAHIQGKRRVPDYRRSQAGARVRLPTQAPLPTRAHSSRTGPGACCGFPCLHRGWPMAVQPGLESPARSGRSRSAGLYRAPAGRMLPDLRARTGPLRVLGPSPTPGQSSTPPTTLTSRMHLCAAAKHPLTPANALHDAVAVHPQHPQTQREPSTAARGVPHQAPPEFTRTRRDPGRPDPTHAAGRRPGSCRHRRGGCLGGERNDETQVTGRARSTHCTLHVLVSYLPTHEAADRLVAPCQMRTRGEGAPRQLPRRSARHHVPDNDESHDQSDPHRPERTAHLRRPSHLEPLEASPSSGPTDRSRSVTTRRSVMTIRGLAKKGFMHREPDCGRPPQRICLWSAFPSIPTVVLLLVVGLIVAPVVFLVAPALLPILTAHPCRTATPGALALGVR